MRGKREAMPDPPSRRRRTSSPPSRSGGGAAGGGPLPTAALAVGVVVAGLGIGALISAFQNRGAPPQLGATSVPAVTPVPQPSPPSPFPTLAATPSPAPSPTPTAAPRSSPLAPAAPKPAATAAAPSSSPSAAALPSAAPLASASPPHAAPTVKPTLPAAAAAATAPPAAHPVPASGDPALALVRRYIQSLIGGDEAGAYAALGGTSSDRSLDLKEEAFLGKDARITAMRVSRADAAGETIDADITSGSGSYVATYRVTNGPGGPTITQHDFIKV
jgi:hypothetical protein